MKLSQTKVSEKSKELQTEYQGKTTLCSGKEERTDQEY
jgi:hypothetical protein